MLLQPSMRVVKKVWIQNWVPAFCGCRHWWPHHLLTKQLEPGAQGGEIFLFVLICWMWSEFRVLFHVKCTSCPSPDYFWSMSAVTVFFFSSLSPHKIEQKRSLTNWSHFIGFWSQLIICFFPCEVLGFRTFLLENAFWNSLLLLPDVNCLVISGY